MSQGRWILFDAVGTLLHPEPSALEVYGEVARQHGVWRTADELKRRFRAALQLQFAPDPTAADPWWTSESRERERWRAIVGSTLELPEGDTLEACFERLWNHFRQPAHWRVTEQAEAVFARLRSHGCRIALASNFDARLEDLCRGLAPLSSADRIFHSALLGTRKPGPAFFRAIEHQLETPSSQLTLVGDDLEIDYRAALAAGWRAHCLQDGWENWECWGVWDSWGA